MEVADAHRRPLTLSDQLAVPDSPDLRDLLKAAHSRRRRRRRGRGEAFTLASAIAAEKRTAATVADATEGGVGRTLLDVLRDDEPRDPRHRQRQNRWPTLESVFSAEIPLPDPSPTTMLEVILSEPLEVAEAPPTESAASSSEEESQPTRVSLMALLEQSEWQGGGGGNGNIVCSDEDSDLAVAAVEAEAGDAPNVWLCCVCMVRHKGAAFIPCGHTFCRGCSRELLARRGSCPLCNAGIDDVLDIY